MGRQSRNTRQKELIRSEIEKRKTVTAEELYESVRKNDSRIGIATVYRFLRDAKDSGDLYAYECEGKTVYSTAKKDHCHFVCKKCGKIVHFNVHSLDFLKKRIDGSVNQFQISVEGLCRNCT
ncbi:MAG TPA: transcriptional repressor [Candidatus Nanoarchaeia archaeon]|nr:transcriptional repressor [Candidatus Nanoarchaeia archaeon]